VNQLTSLDFIDRLPALATKLLQSVELKQLAAYAPKSSAEDLHMPYDEYNRWAGLPEDFVSCWGYRCEPTILKVTKLLRLICQYQWGSRIVRFVRRTIDTLDGSDFNRY
jgi:hypothetical protein